MDSIGIRELRQHASKYVKRASEGETILVTDRGRPVARLVPARPPRGIAELRAAGLITESKGDLLDIVPVRLGRGQKPLSQALEELRRDER